MTGRPLVKLCGRYVMVKQFTLKHIAVWLNQCVFTLCVYKRKHNENWTELQT